MDRYVTVVGVIQQSRFRAWLRKEMKKHEKLNLVSNAIMPARGQGSSVLCTLIFEEPLGTLEAQLGTMDSLLGVDADDDPDLDDWVGEE